MVKIWDDRLKRLVGTLPDDFVDWLMPGAYLVSIVSLELEDIDKNG